MTTDKPHATPTPLRRTVHLVEEPMAERRYRHVELEVIFDRMDAERAGFAWGFICACGLILIVLLLISI